MHSAAYRGVVRGRTVLLDEAAPLADGTEVLVTPVDSHTHTADAFLAAINAEPHVATEDVDALERAIVAGRRPRSDLNPFGGNLDDPGQ